ncbi:MAG: hypothetical protein CFE50_11940 [Pseudomonas sp. PGPPP4]|uniref:PA3496 family putative envelope integrity protein n=1 Tax=Pseudomonas TaxID=286 RepID=UPI000BDB5E08|nr:MULTISPECIES: hypothetical protein [Pseudomonas]MCI1011084.1 hypothetical protein [Pseudomonas oryzihabitans]OYT83679.1 MAG: hypothetical protein CFE50_11940 [Pseudomonas sp. PGPPP4]
MAEDKSDIDVDDDFEGEAEAPETVEPVVSKTNLTKRRLIDDMLEERRLKRQISEYDFDL